MGAFVLVEGPVSGGAERLLPFAGEVEQAMGGGEEELVLGRAFEVIAATGTFVVQRAELRAFHLIVLPIWSCLQI
jgi:hypothetical protein